MTKLGIYADGGEKFGLGHISRSIALAKDLGILEVDILSDMDDLSIFDTQVKCHKILDFSPTKIYDILIIDTYQKIPNIQKYGKNIIYFSDEIKDFKSQIQSIKDKSYFIINTSNASFIESKNIFCSLKYAKGFDTKYKIKINPKIQNIICSFGSMDSQNHIQEIQKISQEKYQNINFHILQTSLNKTQILQNQNIKIYKNLSKNEIFNIAKNMDLAICSAGVSLIEFLSISLPCMLLCDAENQSGNIEQLKDILPLISSVDSISLPSFTDRQNISSQLNFIGEKRDEMLHYILENLQ